MMTVNFMLAYRRLDKDKVVQKYNQAIQTFCEKY